MKHPRGCRENERATSSRWWGKLRERATGCGNGAHGVNRGGLPLSLYTQVRQKRVSLCILVMQAWPCKHKQLVAALCEGHAAAVPTVCGLCQYTAGCFFNVRLSSFNSSGKILQNEGAYEGSCGVSPPHHLQRSARPEARAQWLLRLRHPSLVLVHTMQQQRSACAIVLFPRSLLC